MSAVFDSQVLVNPHLPGKAFTWLAGKNAPGALLIHGFTATPAEMHPLGQELHSQGYNVTAPLLPGHGLTPQQLNTCRWQDWLGAVEQAYQALRLNSNSVAVCGESMGGLLSICLAASHPEIASLVLMAPALHTAKAWLSWLAPLLSGIKPYVRKRPGRPSAADARWQGYNVYPSRAARQLFALQVEARRRLANIQQPVLVIQGRLDRAVHPRVPAVIAGRVKSDVIEIRWLERSGHCVAIDEEWQQVAALAEGFLRRWT